MPSSSLLSGKPNQARTFFINVLWNWLSVGANLFTAIFLTRYMIRKLGDQRYGTWTLVFTLIEYVFVFDLGFRSAIVNFVSRFRIQKDDNGINEVINTAFFYFSCVAMLLVCLTVTLAGQGYRFFQIAPGDRADFTFLLMLLGFTWAAGIVSSIFQASLEAFQQFKTYNHIFIIMMVLRASGCAILLYLGFGLRGMGVSVVAAQCLGYILMFATFRRAFPALHFSRRFVIWERWKEMAHFGVRTLIAGSSLLFLNQGPPLLIGHYLPAAFVGYYTFPSRLLSYAVEMISRIGFVTAPKTAELYALGHHGQIVRMGTYINRYSLSMFLPLSIFMAVFGRELLTLWISPSFAAHSGHLLPIFATSVALAVAGQFNSSSIVFGVGKHGPYAMSMVVEAAVTLMGIVLVLPHYGIFGAACLVAVLSVTNRGLITPWIVCHQLDYSYARYMTGIYLRPLITAIPLLGLAIWIKSFWLSGQTWFELAIVAAIIGTIGLFMCLFTCVETNHRVMLRDMIFSKLRLAES